MTQHQSTALGRSIARFFQEYLPTLRGMSPHTIRSYRDTMILFLRFAAAQTGGSIESLDVRDINADRLGGFLTSLEVERGNSIATRNARLAAMHGFGRFLIADGRLNRGAPIALDIIGDGPMAGDPPFMPGVPTISKRIADCTSHVASRVYCGSECFAGS